MDTLRLRPLAAWMGRGLATPEFAGVLEEHGYGAMWIGGAKAETERLLPLLEATDRLVIATGIVNIWEYSADQVAIVALQLLERHPDRFLLGIGAGHPHRHVEATRPMDALERYFDALDSAGVPSERVVLAALGPKMLRLAAERSAGAHPYLTPPLHTAEARAILGARALLIPEQRAVLSTDRARVREIGGGNIANPYFTIRNYRNNLLRLGYSAAELDEVRMSVVNALVAWGEDSDIADRLRAHLDEGADQVALQLIEPDIDRAVGYARIARAFGALQPS